MTNLPTPPSAIAVADLNRDQVPDIALVAEDLYVLVGRGDGTFRAPLKSSGVPQSGVRLLLSDFDRDGLPDAVVPTADNGCGKATIWIALGKGDGTFGTPVELLHDLSCLDQQGFDVTATDITNDGILDLVGANGDMGLWTLIGRGDGTFQQGLSTSAPGRTNACFRSFDIAPVHGDFNLDGNSDIVVVDRAPFLGIYLGDGNDTFQREVFLHSVLYGVPDVGVADFNVDGALDLEGNDASTGFCIYAGCGDGQFGPAGCFRACEKSQNDYSGINLVADLNGDAKPDVIVGCYNSNPPMNGYLGILLNQSH